MAEEHKRAEGARTKAATSGEVNQGKVGGDWKFQAKPKFLDNRVGVWDTLFNKQKEVYSGK